MTGLMMKDALVMRKTLRLYVHGPGYGGGDRDGAAHLQLQL